MAGPDYGIDAPSIIRRLTISGVVAIVAAIIFIVMVIYWLGISLLLLAAILFAEAGLMLRYARRGKFRHRDRILAHVAWRGDEQVLDVGTGGGLLLVGAAKRLRNGHAIGVDTWNPQDLRKNSEARTRANLAVEGVAERCELRSEPAQSLSFADATFDVVLSNLCLHSIKTKEGRRRACMEIARVLKPGGTAVISDLFYARSYARAFRDAGMSAVIDGPYFFTVFPPQNIVVARK